MLPTDITARRHGGNPHSVDANARVAPFKVSMRERVPVFIVGCGFAGATLPEIARAFNRQKNEISGRASELKATSAIFNSGRTRDGAGVLVAGREWVRPACAGTLLESVPNGQASLFEGGQQ